MNAVLALEDGTWYQGISAGAPGQTEGEVVFKVGKPDHEAVIRDERGVSEEKTWTYFPHSRDPQTVTIVTFHAGVVSRVDRKISR